MLLVRASSLPTFADCEMRWAVSNVPEIREIAILSRPEIKTRIQIGAAFGDSLHKAAAYAMQVNALTEKSLEIANKRLDELAKYFYIEFDDHTTKNLDQARKQLVAPLKSFWKNYGSKVDKGDIEKRLYAKISDYVTLTGQVDHRLTTGKHDLKFGMLPMVYNAQLGGYDIVSVANYGIADGSDLWIISIPRCKEGAVPDFHVIKLDYQGCVNAAWQQLDRIEEAHRRWSENKSNLWYFNRNPNSNLCRKKFCDAWGTTACDQWKSTSYKEF